MAYMPSRNGLIMHGGWGPPDWQPLSETWKLDGQGWHLLSVSNAPALTHHSMAYDTARGVIVAVGEFDSGSGGYPAYEFDGNGWSSATNVPLSTTGNAKLTYDTDRKRIVLYWSKFTFGGGQQETFEYDGTNWFQMQPPQRPIVSFDGASLAYDAKLKRSVLVGGDASGVTQTWLWDGANWSQAAGTQPPNALLGSMAFDQARQQLVLLAADTRTWTFNGSGWNELMPAQPPDFSMLGYFTMGYDPNRAVIAFFGGEGMDNGGDLVHPDNWWEWDGTDWHVFAPASEPVALAISRINGRQFIINWPVSAAGLTLEMKNSLSPNVPWQKITSPPTAVGGQLIWTNSASGDTMFFRLSDQP